MKKKRVAIGVGALGLLICGAGIYIGEIDDAPGAALMGIMLMIAAIIVALRIARKT